MKSIRCARFSGAMLVVALVGACARQENAPQKAPSDCVCSEGAPGAVNQQLMAWLSKARTLHHLADLADGDGGVDRAIAPLDQLVNGVRPQGSLPEVDEVLADTHARLAELRAQRGDFERAEREIVRGLAYTPEVTYFRGHLLEVRGLVYEKQYESLAKANKLAEAEEARSKAMRASLEAVRVQDEVIGKALRPAPAAASAAPPNPNARD
jgi:hypothetical protein